MDDLITFVSFLKVQPDMEELTDNAEEPDQDEAKPEAQKLGKLKYKVSFLDDSFIRRCYSTLITVSVYINNIDLCFLYKFIVFRCLTLSIQITKGNNTRGLKWIVCKLIIYRSFVFFPRVDVFRVRFRGRDNSNSF